ncbi:MAG: hypothetical protein IPJ85_10030 [Flavobacteriales bacterium]|nr:hypothetical protein [Flavobacteriales bacterium]
MTALGAAGGGASITWDLGGGVPSDAVGANTQVAFMAVGVHPVTLTITEFGCTAQFTDSITVYPYPVADFINGSLACLGQNSRSAVSVLLGRPSRSKGPLAMVPCVPIAPSAMCTNRQGRIL